MAFLGEDTAAMSARCTLHIVTLLIVALLAGCSWKSFDHKNPEDFHRYWQDDDTKRNSLLYPFTAESKEDKRKQFEVNRSLK